MLQPMIFANKTHTFTFLEIFIYAFLIEVKWVLGSITMNKASGGDGTPVELFQILKDDGVITHLEPDILECKVGLRKHQYKARW